MVLGDPCPYAPGTPCKCGDGRGKRYNAGKPLGLTLQLMDPDPLSPDLVFGSDKIGGHPAEEDPNGAAATLPPTLDRNNSVNAVVPHTAPNAGSAPSGSSGLPPPPAMASGDPRSTRSASDPPMADQLLRRGILGGVDHSARERVRT
uniref:Uncharacterized protein n=1 Tax=Arundo donax TaxID=35708 RepID=A0A0A9EWI0_ARUDO